ncbi:MAG TPA: hypothetical protein VEG64_13715 [Candidatus Sulfotelmatobacter sp.]|nr:hypothetical protein [Candidatus Sulfotelmatobacter sp.]
MNSNWKITFGVVSLCAALAGTSVPAWAQAGPPVENALPPAAPTAATPASVASPPASEKLVLKEGMEVPLVFAQDLNSKTAGVDDPVNMRLDDDLKIGDVVVIRKGAPALATVTHVKKAGMMGKGGELNIRLDYIKTDEGRIRLRGTKGKEGEDKVGATVALTVLFGPIGLIKHGKNVEIKEGTPLTAYIDQDTSFSPAR